MDTIALSPKINFDESHIGMGGFKEFVEILRTGDPKAYADEGKDGFLDLFNYWSAMPARNFSVKLQENRERFA